MIIKQFPRKEFVIGHEPLNYSWEPVKGKLRQCSMGQVGPLRNSLYVTGNDVKSDIFLV